MLAEICDKGEWLDEYEQSAASLASNHHVYAEGGHGTGEALLADVCERPEDSTKIHAKYY